MTRACVVDIETLDTSATAAIVSIGAVIIDTEAPNFTVLGSFYQTLNIDGQERSISQSTLRWWMEQAVEVRAAMVVDERRKDLEEALDIFGDFLRLGEQQNPVGEIWSKPSMFDLTILQNAYEQQGSDIPWNHRATRCLRTLTTLYPGVPEPVFVGVKHLAIDDALQEAKWLHAIMTRNTRITSIVATQEAQVPKQS